MKKRNISLDVLKVLTMFLIINSHSDILYPQKIQFLASGGGIGNELFFLISGYLFSAKPDIRNDIFIRFIKLYIPAYLMIAVTAVCGQLRVDSIVQFIRVFVWPTQFWFVGAIFAYSVILYVLKKCNIEKRNVFIAFVLIIAVIDITLYVLCVPDKISWVVENAYISFVPFRSIYSIIAFVLGYYIKNNFMRFKNLNEITIVVIAVLSFVGFYVFKFLLNKKIVPMTLQIFSRPLTIICAFFIFLSFAKVDMNLKFEGTKLEKCINALASLSLEAYLVQFLIITGISSLGIAFPVDLIVCFILVMVCSFVLKQIDSWIIKIVLQVYKPRTMSS